MPDGLSISIPGSPSARLGKSAGGHWRTRRAAWNNALETGLVLWREALAPYPDHIPWQRVHVEVMQFWCGKPLDRDNLLGRMGAYLDAGQAERIIETRNGPVLRPGAGVFKDDGPDCVQSLTTRYERVRRRAEARVVLTVRRLS